MLAALELGLALGLAAGCSAGGSSGRDGAGGGAAAGGPSPASDRALIEWRRFQEPSERLAIGLGGYWLGSADGPRAHYLFAGGQRRDDLALFARTYAGFRQLDAQGELVFHGSGAAPAGAAERRMIGEWARRVAAESGGDAGPSPYGLAFAWHRGAATGGACDDLAVFLSGEVRAGSCGAGAEVQGRLAAVQLERLYAWIDGLAPFQAAGEQGVRADALLERLIFAGRGQRPAAPADVAAIEALAGSLHREIQAAALPERQVKAALAEAAAAATPRAAAAARAAAPTPAPPGDGGPADAGPAGADLADDTQSASSGTSDDGTTPAAGAAPPRRPGRGATARPPADAAPAAAAGAAADEAEDTVPAEAPAAAAPAATPDRPAAQPGGKPRAAKPARPAPPAPAKPPPTPPPPRDGSGGGGGSR